MENRKIIKKKQLVLHYLARISTVIGIVMFFIFLLQLLFFIKSFFSGGWYLSRVLLFLLCTSISVLLLFLTIKITKKRPVNVKRLGMVMLCYTPFIFILSETLPVQRAMYSHHKSFLDCIIYYLSNPIIIFSLVYFIVCIGILKYKNWGRILGICTTGLISVFSFWIWIVSLVCFYFYLSIPGITENKELPASQELALTVGPMFFIVLLCPFLLFLYSLFSAKVKEQFK